MARRSAAALKVEQVRLEDMNPARWNPRAISEFQLDSLKQSLTEFGVVEPVVLNRDGTILGGHQRYAAAIALGWESLPAVRVDLDDRRARILNLGLNKIGGEWDVPMLARLVEEIDGEPVELALAGFPADEVERLLRSLEDNAPGEFPGVDETIDHRCPSCGYGWKGPCQ